MTYVPLETIAGQLRDGTVTAAALLGDATARHGATEERLRAYRTWAGPRAKTQAGAMDALLQNGIDLGPLMGIPVSIKDLYGVPGLPVFAGTDTEFDENWQKPGPVVKHMLAQGSIVTGKTHTVEFAFGGLGTNPHCGTPLNPWSSPAAPRVPGGSSSGAGVSLAQGSALAALGTDTAGSVRIPASFTGQAALKVTHGRWSLKGIVPLSPSFDTPGLLARSVKDLAFLFEAIEGGARIPVQDLSGLRLGVVKNVVWDQIDPVIAANTQAALAAFEAAGAIITEVQLLHAEDALDIFRRGGLAATELRAFLDTTCPERMMRLDPTVMARVAAADEVTGAEYLKRRDALRGYGHTASAVFEAIDLLVTPTVPISAPLLADLGDPDNYRTANMLALRNTAVVNLLGWCATTLPTGLDGNGIPTGLQLIAPPGQEVRLLAASLGAEHALGAGPELLGAPPL